MIGILVGTRPELIKMAPVFRELDKKNIPYLFIHSNQHYSSEMDEQIMRDLRVRTPDVQLKVGSGSHAVQTGKILEGVERVCTTKALSFMIVHGDTNTTLAGALGAKKLHIPIGHIEAGLRSHDYTMPEEINRILTDRISDILFAPTNEAKENLKKEGISKGVYVVGNTIVDAVYQHLPLTEHSTILQKTNLRKEAYVLVTAHRAENVDEKKRLEKLLFIVDYASQKLSLPILWPMHPRTAKSIEKHKLHIPKSIQRINPVGYIDMLTLLQHASYILTDSGGIQEEAYILKKRLITLRSSTERPETLSANVIVDLHKKKFDDALRFYETGKARWHQKFGDGKASARIVEILMSLKERK